VNGDNDTNRLVVVIFISIDLDLKRRNDPRIVILSSTTVVQSLYCC